MNIFQGSTLEGFTRFGQRGGKCSTLCKWSAQVLEPFYAWMEYKRYSYVTCVLSVWNAFAAKVCYLRQSKPKPGTHSKEKEKRCTAVQEQQHEQSDNQKLRWQGHLCCLNLGALHLHLFTGLRQKKTALCACSTFSCAC